VTADPAGRTPLERGREQLRAVEAAEQATLNSLIVVIEAESVVAGARFADLDAASKAARRRLSAARGRLTRARRDGSAKKITEAQAALRDADAEAERIAEAALAEMQQLIRGKLDSLGAMTTQIGVAWDAQAAVTDTYRHPPVPQATPAEGDT